MKKVHIEFFNLFHYTLISVVDSLQNISAIENLLDNILNREVLFFIECDSEEYNMKLERILSKFKVDRICTEGEVSLIVYCNKCVLLNCVKELNFEKIEYLSISDLGNSAQADLIFPDYSHIMHKMIRKGYSNTYIEIVPEEGEINITSKMTFKKALGVRNMIKNIFNE